MNRFRSDVLAWSGYDEGSLCGRRHVGVVFGRDIDGWGHVDIGSGGNQSNFFWLLGLTFHLSSVWVLGKALLLLGQTRDHQVKKGWDLRLTCQILQIDHSQ